MVNGDFKYLIRRTGSYKLLRDKAFNVAKNSKYDEYQRGLLRWFMDFLIKKILLHLHGQRSWLVVVSKM